MEKEIQKIIVVIMGQNCEKHIGMCLNSVKDADAIVYCDGGSEDKTVEEIIHQTDTKDPVTIIINEFNQEDKQMNGKQRNFYLEYIKKNYPNDWCLILDADELVEDLDMIKKFIQDRKPGIYNVKMRHFIGDLGHEDATRPVHVVPARLFKISEAKSYPLHSHPILEGELMGACLDTVIWHLGHLPILYLDYLKNRYLQHKKDSIIHTSEFLESWYLSHITGHYPAREINILDLPKQLCERYLINKDKFYFQNRGLEVKHFIMMKQWLDYIGISDDGYILDLGCGLGHYGHVASEFLGENYIGVEKSEWAVKNCPYNVCIECGDISKTTWGEKGEKIDLLLCIDVLEHLTKEELDKTLALNKDAKNVIFSIPFEGDPNLESDPTHIIKESKEWWINKLSEYFKIEDAPKEWLFSHQILVGEKK